MAGEGSGRDGDPDGLGPHFDAQGRAHMVEVGDKETTAREAVARARVSMRPETWDRLTRGDVPKGDVLATARVAGIQAAKRTPELIPLCHHIALTGCEVRFAPDDTAKALDIEVRARAADRTGVEMEALAGASVAALAVYDMLKGIDAELAVEHVHVVRKTGGKS